MSNAAFANTFLSLFLSKFFQMLQGSISFWLFWVVPFSPFFSFLRLLALHALLALFFVVTIILVVAGGRTALAKMS
jgi:hypothetical protein